MAAGALRRIGLGAAIGSLLALPLAVEVRVRRALNYAVDKNRLIRAINGRGVPAAGVLPPGMPGYTRRVGYPYDPAKAKRLLAEAGYPDGLKIPIIVPIPQAITPTIRIL